MRIQYALCCFATAQLAANALGQQQPLTPPIQPKTVPVVSPPVITVPAPPGPSKAPNALTAEDAGRIALKNQPQVAIAQAAIQNAHGNVLQAEAALLPTGSVLGGYGVVLSLPGVIPNSKTSITSQGFDLSATASQLLFDFGRTIDSVREAEATEKSATYSLNATQSDTVFSVKQNFYTYVENVKGIDVADANLKDRQDNLALAQARLNSGIGAPGDVVTAQTNLAAATVALITARNTASTSEVALALSMGIDPRTPITIADSQEPNDNVDDVNGLVDQALKQRPELKAQQESLRAAGYQVSVARKGILPSVSLAATASGQSDIGFTREGTIGVSISWDPFDFVGVRGRVESARANLETQRQTLIQQSQNVVSDVANAYLNIKSSEERITTSQSEVTNATEGLRIAEGQFKAGVATFVTVTDAEANLSQARTDLVTAQAALQVARSAMEHALGKAL